MKIYSLWPKKEGSSFWSPWYDKMFEIVVVANDEKQARAIAATHSGEEGVEIWMGDLVHCEEVKPDGGARVVCIDFRSA
jgi:hypothetical protein